jgi:hypothetical protein
LGGAIDPRGTLLINFRIKSCHQCFGYWSQSPSRLSNDCLNW